MKKQILEELEKQSSAFFDEYLKRRKDFVHERDELVRFKSNPHGKDIERQASRVLR